ncbi:hypothetical protein GQ457_09G021410 [Hibiscus cannabinus]
MPRVPILVLEYRYSSHNDHIFKSDFTGEYRYATPCTGTQSCRSSFNASLKLPNGFIYDLNNQNGWKSMKSLILGKIFSFERLFYLPFHFL